MSDSRATDSRDRAPILETTSIRPGRYPPPPAYPPSRLPIFLTFLISLYPLGTWPQEAPRPPLYPAPPDTRIAPPDPDLPWLDEVRAQRKAWEARRDTAREEFENRRRFMNPRGSAHQEAWEEDLRRRRAKRQERIDKERERLLNLGPSQSAPPQPQDPATLDVDPTGTDDPSAGRPILAPPGWNNLWYFRGF